jgi:hypothetical protein
MNIPAKQYHFIIDQQNIEKLQKMIDDVSKDLNTWIDVTFIQEGENPPIVEFAEMLWEPTTTQAFIARYVKYKAEPLE